MIGKKTILPLASALAALSASAATSEASAPANTPNSETNASEVKSVQGEANTIISNGEALMGFVVTDHADGTIVAQHVSHASHASHASHYSSR